jgi:hypothetical protein
LSDAATRRYVVISVPGDRPRHHGLGRERILAGRCEQPVDMGLRRGRGSGQAAGVGLATRARDGRGIAAPTRRLARWCSYCSSSPGASPPPATRRCSPCSSQCSPSPALAPPTTSGGWAGPWPPCGSGAPPQARAGTCGSGTGRQRWPREGDGWGGSECGETGGGGGAVARSRAGIVERSLWRRGLVFGLGRGPNVI